MRTRNRKTGEFIGTEGEATLVGGDSGFAASLGQISTDDLKKLYANNSSLTMTGMYQYCDELGTDTRHMFTTTYRNAPNDDLKFGLLDDHEIPVARPLNTAEIEYLPPCVTMAVRVPHKTWNFRQWFKRVF